MHPAAQHASCCKACPPLQAAHPVSATLVRYCAQPVSVQRPGNLEPQITSLSAGKSPGANEIFMSQGIQGLRCKERNCFYREDELEGNILLESMLL